MPSMQLRHDDVIVNAVAESWFSMLKNEMYHRRSSATRAQARFHVMQYIEVFYNRRRRHSPINPSTIHLRRVRAPAPQHAMDPRAHAIGQQFRRHHASR